LKIEDIKSLKQVLKLCRENGVSAIEIDGIKLNIALETKKAKVRQVSDFSSDIPEANIKVPQYNGEVADDITTDELTPDQLLFYSSTPEPGQDNPQ